MRLQDRFCRTFVLAVSTLAWGCSGGSATSLITDVSGSDLGIELAVEPDLAGGETALDLWVPEEVAVELRFPEVALEVDVGPEIGGAGWPCENNSDCVSGFCIPTPEGKQCTIQCEEECPFGWECALHQASLPDEVLICVPPDVVLCRPCNVNVDCLAGGADVGAVCVGYGDAGAFCATVCSEDELCVEPYKCLGATDATGADVDTCVLELPECQCTPLFSDQGAWTACAVTNEHGSCEGLRECKADGLTACDAPVPVAEECNGEDDDCDGAVDEETSGIACVVENDFGLCEGKTLCMGGVPVCDAADPEPEDCDGKDNNCNGEIDEEFPDTDDDGIADCMEVDKDADDVVDGADNCQYVYNPGQEDFDLDGMGDACDPDDDDDKVADGDDCAPLDSAVYPGAPEQCNGQDDNCDNLVDEGFPDQDGDLTPDCLDTDVDGDGIPNGLDNCPGQFNPLQADADQDGLGDQCDEDDDGDFVADEADNCPLDPNPGQEDQDGDSKGDFCDDDDDGDGVPDVKDNCPMTTNPGQEDADKDGVGDVCEDDVDGDLVPDADDNCPETPNADQVDCDDDGAGAVCDDDDDDDGIDDSDDNCLCLHNDTQDDLDEDGLGDACDNEMDGDGIADGLDNCPGNFNPAQGDQDQDGKGDACDDDDDNDDVPDIKDNCPTKANPQQEDMDEDGLGDACDDDKDGDQDPDATDCAPANPEISHFGEEICDGIDNNCSLVADEGFKDTDLDGFKDCVDTDDDGDDDPDETDCQPLNPAVHHAAAETCNGLDDDCNEQADDGLGTATCGIGECLHTIENCVDGAMQVCNPVEGAANEVCDGLDNNCNGIVDDGTGITTCGTGPCQHTVPDCLDGQPNKCDPLEGAMPEECDGVDNNCNGIVDDGLGTATCGIGACLKTVANCLDGKQQVCDPGSGASDEICDGIDNDCNGPADDGLGATTCGIGPCEHTVDNCVDGQPVVCDPFEGAQDEICDGLDNNCDGLADEGEPDTDNDGTKDCLDDDDDNDGLPDELDGWPTDPDKVEGPTGGSGSDGGLVVTNTYYMDQHVYSLDQIAPADTTFLVLKDAGPELSEGDELLIWNQKNKDWGRHQFVYVTGMTDQGVVKQVDFAPQLAFDAYPDDSVTLVMRVPQFTSVQVESGGIITAHPFGVSGPGGAVVFRSKTTVTVAAGGSITASALGFMGGPAIAGNGSAPFQGDSYFGEPQSGNSGANLGGGGAYPTRGDHGDSGGGGGYGLAGAWGTEYGGANVCEGGKPYGDAALVEWHVGSGGGAGSPDAEGDGAGGGNVTGKGGDGGGFVAVFAGESITLGGAIAADGQQGADAQSGGGEVGGGGGGSGGTVLLTAPALQLEPGHVTATGGAGGSSAWHDGKPYGSAYGGAGGAGRIRLNYSTLNGTSWPDGDANLTTPAAYEEEL